MKILLVPAWGKRGWAMGDVARKIESYNLAYQLAWKHISEDGKRKQLNMARLLHDSIRRQLSEGATEPVFIASKALEDVGEKPEMTSSQSLAARPRIS